MLKYIIYLLPNTGTHHSCTLCQKWNFCLISNGLTFRKCFRIKQWQFSVTTSKNLYIPIMAYFNNSFIPLCTKVTEIPSSSSFRLEGIILLLSKTKRNRCSSSVSLSENFQKCWIGCTKKKNSFTKLIGLTRKVEEFFYIKKCSRFNNLERQKSCKLKLIQLWKIPLSNLSTH